MTDDRKNARIVPLGPFACFAWAHYLLFTTYNSISQSLLRNINTMAPPEQPTEGQESKEAYLYEEECQPLFAWVFILCPCLMPSFW
jgi:hypothetical protein